MTAEDITLFQFYAYFYNIKSFPVLELNNSMLFKNNRTLKKIICPL